MALKLIWLIPFCPLIAAGLTALARQRHRRFASSLAIGSLGVSLMLSIWVFGSTLGGAGEAATKQVFNFPWFQIGGAWLKLGWLLDPLTAVMLVMVCFVGLLIFIYSTAYMAHDENFTRFFCFLSLFAAAMLGLLIANSLLLFFICWELVGLTSYLLIGFWFHKPSAAAAAKKAFITTRIGDLAFLLGMVWLYSQTGTLLFYDDGRGCLEQSALSNLVTQTTWLGLTVSSGIGLLIFCGAVGKSGQVPLHVWLPDAMEGPTPVSALIHAATMVAAGVFLVARVFPLMGAHPAGAPPETAALQVIAWVGAVTALFAATIAVAQTDIKRVLAYSTVSQLGFMMLGLGTGGVAVGMFHLITHAFFKALLFLGAGSVIHGCQEEQDIRRMGGLRQWMPVTFATYAVGMLALSGFPLLFSGFWSKDEILHSAHAWRISHGPFLLGLFSALLTAFYMTRQVLFVFFGSYRGATASGSVDKSHAHDAHEPHESPPAMTVPLVVLAAFAILLGFLGTPVWPWFQAFLANEPLSVDVGRLFHGATLATMVASTALALLGIGLGFWLYGRKPVSSADSMDVLERVWPNLYTLLRRKYYVDEAYEWAVVGLNRVWGRFCDGLDRWVWSGVVQMASFAAIGLAWVDRFFDEFVINLGFDEACSRLRSGGGLVSLLQNGKVQHYLRIIGVGMVLLLLVLIGGCQTL
jgi:NADH-quinone oxidoreductase subunit L